jgi:diaminopimelate epimerase
MSNVWPFAKMHGIGNDYIYFNCLEQDFPDPSKNAIKLADRHFGIGGDGIVLIKPSKIADYRMQMLNSDGSEAEMCGNAIRCVGKFLFDKDITQKTELKIETLAGVKVLDLKIQAAKVSSVRVDMGVPELISTKIPVNIDTEKCIAQPFEIEDFSSPITCVSMGNPHAVFFVGNGEITDRHVLSIGPKIEVHTIFPKKINVEFVKVISKSELQMRVWERGAGETLACGTGAAAVCVAASLNGLADRKVKINLLGGDLELEWASNNHVFKTGPAEFVFEGEVNLS